MPARLLPRKQVADELNISRAQTYALIRRGPLRAAKFGGRGDHRIGRDDLEAYAVRTYSDTRVDRRASVHRRRPQPRGRLPLIGGPR